MSLPKQSVLVIGATGRTGTVVANALLEDKDKFEVHIAVRPESASKPAAKLLTDQGAVPHFLDVDHASAEEIATQLSGIDTVISCLLSFPLTKQTVLVDACVLAKVKRFVPSEWATGKAKGRLGIIGDEKITVQKYIKERNVPYTFIDVGWWMQLSLPVLDPSTVSSDIAPFSHFFSTRIGTGDVKSAVTDCRDIGRFVARIITDDRTLNRYVFAYSEHFTQKEIIKIAEETSGRSIALTYKSATDLETDYARISPEDIYAKVGLDYMRSMWISGDNTIEKAKEAAYGGALDARELYPDFEPNTLVSYAKEYYANLH